MGFLSTNVRVRKVRPKHQELTKPNKRAKLGSPRPDFVRPSLEWLPREVLYLIFIYSCNLELPQASLAIARKLKRTPYLLDRYLQSLVTDKALPVTVTLLPGVTDETLQRLGNVTFSPLIVPYGLVCIVLRDRPAWALRLVAFLLLRGCQLAEFKLQVSAELARYYKHNRHMLSQLSLSWPETTGLIASGQEQLKG